MRIGIDVGGTFTDVVMVDDAKGQFYFTKTSTTRPDLWRGTLNGIAKILGIAGATIHDVNCIVHGTTIGTNALIERKGARTGLLTTEGFVDALEIGRVQRPAAALYNIFIDNPLPVVPRSLRRGIPERLDARGHIIRPLDEEAVRREVRYLKEQQVESIAVCYLFGFLHPAHERRTAEIIREEFPECFVSLASEIAPEFREYERTNTTCVNAYLQPVMKRYLERLEAELHAQYGPVDLRIMQASGGTMTLESAKTLAVNTVNSGPAGGALAAAYIGQITRHKKIIGVDMGGTSYDIGLIDEGVPRTTSENKFEGLPIKIPMLDVDSIGAGGGSIAWIDAGGCLNVGPRSASSWPGPACYGRGGDRPTVTDANLVLGRINPDYFLGGEMKLATDKAQEAIRVHVAEPLGMTVEEAAAGIIRVVNAKMAKGINTNSVEKGFDVREFALVSFGGAGSLHAAELGQDLGIRTVIVPPLCGNLSAFGLLVADARHDFVTTTVVPLAQADPAELTTAFQAMESQGTARLLEEHFRTEDIGILWSADLRYEGQGYELNVPVDRRSLTTEDLGVILRRFHDLHHRRYAYSSEDEPVQFVNLRVTAVGQTPPVQLRREERHGNSPAEALKGRRRAYWEGRGFEATAIYERDRLYPGAVVEGPAVIEEQISVLTVPPGSTAHVDEYGNLIVTVE